MKVKVDGKEVEVKEKPKTVAELLANLKITEEEVLVKINGKLVSRDREIQTKDRIEILKVIFGG
jgi:thiamine biosynthesis protein ThiS